MDKLEFNNKKQCGLWLMLVGVVIVLSDIFGGDFLINPIVFLAGYYICFFSVNVNKKVRKKLSQGPLSKFQIKMIYVSLIMLFVLMFCIAGPFIPGWNWRLIWLGVFLATAIHFIPWFTIHGFSMLALAMVDIIVCIIGYAFPEVSIKVIGYVDAITKIILGTYLFFLSKPSAFVFRGKAKDKEQLCKEG
ncbi:DUF6609 family protein [Butyrivibrio sp. LC3010]|uniref:DUF6609 family protein n=1 Tax=Butyrivibrio sp. LC3010 TaxID=1280680 RepID=UPI000411B82B|nr:DUF6609 family protein [Butyrivibrio sp. LC3010]